MGKSRRNRVEPTDDPEQFVLVCRWPEQAADEDEEIRPPVLFGSPAAQGVRRLSRFWGCGPIHV